MPKRAESRPAKRPVKPSRATMRWAASRKDESARLDSTWARVERVIRGYLPGGYVRWMVVVAKRETDVRIMERTPPPAPARACEMLSFWGMTGLDWTGIVDGR